MLCDYGTLRAVQMRDKNTISTVCQLLSLAHTANNNIPIIPYKPTQKYIQYAGSPPPPSPPPTILSPSSFYHSPPPPSSTLWRNTLFLDWRRPIFLVAFPLRQRVMLLRLANTARENSVISLWLSLAAAVMATVIGMISVGWEGGGIIIFDVDDHCLLQPPATPPPPREERWYHIIFLLLILPTQLVIYHPFE